MAFFIIILLLIFVYLAGIITHWVATGDQRRLLKEYKNYKHALTAVEQRMLKEKKGRR